VLPPQSCQARAIELLDHLPDQIERIAAIGKLIDLYPAEVGQLCERLSEGPSKERCKLATMRDHLRMDLPSVGTWSAAMAGKSGQSQNDRLALSSPLADVAPDAGDCQDAPDLSGCLIHAALEQVKLGNVQRVAALCNAVPLSGAKPNRWRSECFFEAAERTLGWRQQVVPSGEKYASAVALCGASTMYNSFCQKHLLGLMSREVPAADEEDPASWEEVRRRADIVGKQWTDPSLKRTLVSGLWAVAVAKSFGAVSVVSGDVVDQVPTLVLPHVRAAAAVRMLSQEDPSALSLEEWAESTETALKRRLRKPPLNKQFLRFQPAHAVWPRHLAEKAELPIISYRGAAIRVVAEDPRTDMIICVLEAAGRTDPVATALLREGVGHSDPLVRWTAEQLLEWHDRKGQ
jgi:hypothetical protein